MTRLALWLIRGYRYAVSPALPPACRFTPTCSQYAEESLRAHGLFHGLGYALRRLLRCHPWHPGGHDPIPMRHPREIA
jgi:hypothetical protein